MKTNKYKILVLSDLKKSTNTTLNNTIGLAKKIDADVEFFHVTKPTEVIERESQLSAVRTLNEQFIVTDKKIKALLEPMAKTHNINVKHKCVIGNIKDEIEAKIKAVNPDIIVLGKRNPKVISFIGDNLTDFVLKKYDGAVMIASNENSLEPNNEWKLGVFNDFDDSNNIITKKLIDSTSTTLKAFRIGSPNSSENRDKETVDYVFEEKPNVIETLSGYVSKNSINLMLMNRKIKNNKKTNYTNKVINKMSVSLLIT